MSKTQRGRMEVRRKDVEGLMDREIKDNVNHGAPLEVELESKRIQNTWTSDRTRSTARDKEKRVLRGILDRVREIT